VVFCKFCYYLWGQRCCFAKTSTIGNDLFVFNKLPLASTLLLPPTTYRCSGVPVSQLRLWRCLRLRYGCNFWQPTRGNSSICISVVRLHRSLLHFLTHILSLQIARLCELCCNEKSCSVLKSLFLEEFSLLHLKMAGFLEVVQRSHTIGVVRGGERAMLSKWLENIVILRLERQLS